ncbi:MAG: Xaa-Pro peptidase family protein [Pseudomonadota bacterium]
MALHFTEQEYSDRLEKLKAAMATEKLDCVLLFAQESMYWLTGYDTFGYAFFQGLVVKSDGEMALLTRSPDLRQARHTSTIENIIIWTDRGGIDPVSNLMKVLEDMDMVGAQIGVEYDTQGLTGLHGLSLKNKLDSFAKPIDASMLVTNLRAVKSPAEIEFVRKAGELSDLALDAALPLVKAGTSEGDILAAMHSAIFKAGGDYAGNEFIIGSGRDALLCRYKSGRRTLSKQDQLTIEWSGAWRHYHAAMMRTIIIGEPSSRHLELYEAAKEALLAVEEAMKVGNQFSDMFDAHAKTFDALGLSRHRLNACGYSMGASFTPCWMDMPMIYAGNETKIDPAMVIFVHMILFDSDSETAMTLGQSYVTSDTGPQSLSRHDIGLISR